MKYVATITLDRAHLSESFDQMRRYGSRWPMIEKAIGLVFICGGLALFAYAQWADVLPLTLVAIGLFEIFSPRIKKFFWLRKLGKTKTASDSIEVLFDEEGFETTSKFSSARMAWAGVEKCVRTPKGILLWPQKGSYIYIPEAAAGADAIAFIASKAG